MLRRRNLRRNLFGFERLERREVLSAVSPIDTLFVDDDGLDMPQAEYSTIQAAVDAADANDRIMVAKGEYDERVVIHDWLDGLELRSQAPYEAVIRAPADTSSHTVLITASEVRLEGFTIHGTPGIGAAVKVAGHSDWLIFDASAHIVNNHIAVRDGSDLTGAQDGIGILVGETSTFDGNVGSATIENNLITDYQKGGIVVAGKFVGGGGYLSTAEIIGNEIVGTPAVSGQAAQNGIQVSHGANAVISHNAIRDNSWTPAPDETPWAASGILLLGAGDVEISHNTITGSEGPEDNNVGIYVFDTDNVQISHNKVQDNDWGILLWDVDDALVEHNKVSDNDVVGIAAYSVTNSDFLFNRGKDNGLDFLDDADEGENNWHKNKGELVFA